MEFQNRLRIELRVKMAIPEILNVRSLEKFAGEGLGKMEAWAGTR